MSFGTFIRFVLQKEFGDRGERKGSTVARDHKTKSFVIDVTWFLELFDKHHLMGLTDGFKVSKLDKVPRRSGIRV